MTVTLLGLTTGLLISGAILAGYLGFNAPPPRPKRPPRSPLATRWMALGKKTQTVILGGLFTGLVVAIWTGWILAIVIVPAAIIGLPILMSPPSSVAEISRLSGLEEWTRALSGILTVGGGLEHAIVGSMRSTPEAIHSEVSRLVARINARWPIETALRAFADDLGNNVGGVGDTVASYLILGARKRGSGLATVLESLAESVSEEVRAQRAIEADRAKPRTTARWVTIISASVLGVLAFTGDYIKPYATPIGQLIIAVLLAAYVGCLLWMRNMAKGTPAPRFIGEAAREGART